MCLLLASKWWTLKIQFVLKMLLVYDLWNPKSHMTYWVEARKAYFGLLSNLAFHGKPHYPYFAATGNFLLHIDNHTLPLLLAMSLQSSICKNWQSLLKILIFFNRLESILKNAERSQMNFKTFQRLNEFRGSFFLFRYWWSFLPMIEFSKIRSIVSNNFSSIRATQSKFSTIAPLFPLLHLARSSVSMRFTKSYQLFLINHFPPQACKLARSKFPPPSSIDPLAAVRQGCPHASLPNITKYCSQQQQVKLNITTEDINDPSETQLKQLSENDLTFPTSSRAPSLPSVFYNITSKYSQLSSSIINTPPLLISTMFQISNNILTFAFFLGRKYTLDV